jgi:hypothetical protein
LIKATVIALTRGSIRFSIDDDIDRDDYYASYLVSGPVNQAPIQPQEETTIESLNDTVRHFQKQFDYLQGQFQKVADGTFGQLGKKEVGSDILTYELDIASGDANRLITFENMFQVDANPAILDLKFELLASWFDGVNNIASTRLSGFRSFTTFGDINSLDTFALGDTVDTPPSVNPSDTVVFNPSVDPSTTDPGVGKYDFGLNVSKVNGLVASGYLVKVAVKIELLRNKITRIG